MNDEKLLADDGCDRQTEWDVLEDQNDQSINESRRQQLRLKLSDYDRRSRQDISKVDFEQWRSDCIEYLSVESDFEARDNEFLDYYRALSQRYPDIFPEDRRLRPQEIEALMDGEVDECVKEVTEDQEFGEVVERCYGDGKDWYESYLDYMEFLAKKLYGDDRTPVLVFDPHPKQLGCGFYSKQEFDNTVLGKVTLLRNPKYGSYREEPRDHDSDLGVIAHEMWHARQRLIVREHPDDPKAKQYEINRRFYILPEHDFARFHYRQQLAEREAISFGEKIASAIKNARRDVILPSQEGITIDN